MSKIDRMSKLGRSKKQAILEIYTAVQSEGSRAGYPTVVVRTTGCTHRCFFGEGGWCDSWQTSIHPERALYSFNDVVQAFEDNPHISEMMLTGGSPTMWPKLVNELTHFAHEKGIFITMETEGSHYLETDYPINLLSISPKFSNSVPKLGVLTPQGKVVDEKMVKQHNKFRLHHDNIAKSIMYHSNFHLKPVIDKDLLILPEVENFIVDISQKLHELGYGANEGVDPPSLKTIQTAVKSKTWCMPAGAERKQLIESYGPVMDMCRDRGYKFTPRPHIIAFDIQRYV